MTNPEEGIQTKEVVQPHQEGISAEQQYPVVSLVNFAENITDPEKKREFLQAVENTKKDGACCVNAMMTALGDRTISEFTGLDFQKMILKVI